MGEQMLVMKSEVVGRPSVVTDDFVQSFDKKMSEVSCEFQQISCTVL
jgi:hypothetical protein